jgi:hypothetical protein
MANRERRIRKSQMISPYGVGAIVEFPKETLMHAGLDAWNPAEEQTLSDDRLARRLKVKTFYEPAQAPEKNKQGQSIPFVRFPLWHVCPRCRTMKKVEWNARHRPVCDSDLKPLFNGLPCSRLTKKWQKPIMVPVRFVMACNHGHVVDFPWIEWAHSSKGKKIKKRTEVCDSPKLRLRVTGRSGLTGLSVKCENCGTGRSLAGATGPKTFIDFGCGGERPWLGPEAKEDCKSGVPPRVTHRGATNIYFPKVISSILIPPYSTHVRRIISRPKNWSLINNSVDADGNINEEQVESLSKFWEIEFDDLLTAIRDKLSGETRQSDQTEDEYRHEEYKAFKVGKNRKTTDDLNVNPQDLSTYDQDIARYFETIILVEKLTETRVLTGFTRINPPDSGNVTATRTASLSKQQKGWLPAVRGYGEGIFFTIKQSILDEWSKNDIVLKRVEKLNNRQNKIRTNQGYAPREIVPAFVLLHSLAHILINRLSFNCGYGSSSLRERIYCRQEGERKMAGVLIYTSASDSEGTLGGLVRQGQHGRFESVLRQALLDALNCSSDPLCIESEGQGADALNLAACHACALLPETSCEEGNRLLDRLLLVGIPQQYDVGYFGSLVNNLLSG